jgi:hypothetical protein
LATFSKKLMASRAVLPEQQLALPHIQPADRYGAFELPPAVPRLSP